MIGIKGSAHRSVNAAPHHRRPSISSRSREGLEQPAAVRLQHTVPAGLQATSQDRPVQTIIRRTIASELSKVFRGLDVYR